MSNADNVKPPSSMSAASPSAIPPPPGVPTPTGNYTTDVYNSVTHVLEVPCARNAFMQGIVSGVGIGFIRGTTAAPIVAGHWAVGTFTLVSIASWQFCRMRMQGERQRVVEMMEATGRRKVVYTDDDKPK